LIHNRSAHHTINAVRSSANSKQTRPVNVQSVGRLIGPQEKNSKLLFSFSEKKTTKAVLAWFKVESRFKVSLRFKVGLGFKVSLGFKVGLRFKVSRGFKASVENL